MMRLSVMTGFFALAPSLKEHALVQEALGKWGHEEESVRFVRASANFVIRFRKHLLTFARLLTAADLQDREAAEWAVNLQAKLERKMDAYRDLFRGELHVRT